MGIALTVGEREPIPLTISAPNSKAGLMRQQTLFPPAVAAMGTRGLRMWRLGIALNHSLQKNDGRQFNNGDDRRGYSSGYRSRTYYFQIMSLA